MFIMIPIFLSRPVSYTMATKPYAPPRTLLISIARDVRSPSLCTSYQKQSGSVRHTYTPAFRQRR